MRMPPSQPHRETTLKCGSIAVQSQKAVTAYFSSKKLLHFDFAEHSCALVELLFFSGTTILNIIHCTTLIYQHAMLIKN